MVNKESLSRPILLKFMQVECHVFPWMTLNSLNGLAPTNIGVYGTVCHQKGNTKKSEL